MNLDLNSIIALCIFIVTFAFILSEKIDRVIVSLGGAAAMVILGGIMGFYGYEEALAMIELDTLTLLFAMMTLVGMLEKTGAFQFLAVRLAKISSGKPVNLLVILGAATSILSMFLDNVTTVVLIAPVTISIAKILKISSAPFLIGEALMSNIGGLSTMVGDPPNLIIASSVPELTFMSFFVHLFPYALISWFVCLFCILFSFKKEMRKMPDDVDALMAMKPEDSLSDPKNALRLAWVFLGVVIMFFMSETIHVKPAVIAVLGTVVGFLLTKTKVDDALSRVDFSILIFFAGLFVAVGGLEYSGLLKSISNLVVHIAKDNLLLCSLVTLVGSAVASAIIDNIPFTIAMIPVIQSLGQTMGDMSSLNPLWWALAIGVGLGGNGTVIGATANVIVVKLSEKTDTLITTRLWMKSGFLTSFCSVMLSALLFALIFNFMKN